MVHRRGRAILRSLLANLPGLPGAAEAMSLLKDLAAEVWERIRMGAAAAGAAATAMFFDLKADAASGMQSAIESVVGFSPASRARWPSR